MPRWRSLLRKARWALPAVLVAVTASIVASLALADNVQNEIVAGVGGDRIRTVIAGNSTTVMYGIEATGSMGLCDAADGTGVTVTPNGMPPGVTATPSSISFTSCPSPTGAGAKGITYNVPASTPAFDYTINVTAADAAGSYNAVPARFILRVQAPPPPTDTTPPVITPNISGTLGNNGWYTSNVTVSWTIVDNESTTTPATCASTTISTDTDSDGTTVTCTSTSAGGTTTRSVTVKRDATAPTLNPSVSPSPVLLNGSATASANASDPTPGSGLASSSCDPVDTGSVGTQTVTCYAADNAGNTNSATASYKVIYDFRGFFQPVDNLPALNTVKAGSAVPVKFSLAGDQGLNIFAAYYPKAITTSCTSATEDAIESTSTAGKSSLSYDPVADQYTYVWKTEKTWTGCRQLVVQLIDGEQYKANFSLK